MLAPRNHFHNLALGWEWPLAIFVAACLISTALSDLPWASFRNLKNLLTILGAYTVAYSLRMHPEWRKPALWIFILSATGAALWGLIEFGLGLAPKVMSTQSTTMTWGAMSAMFILITLSAAGFTATARERWTARMFFIPQIFALFLSLVRGAYVGFAAGVFYLLHRHWKRLVPVLLVLFTLGALFAPAAVKERVMSIVDLKHPSIIVRFEQWKIATHIIADHPFFGVGWHDLAGLTRQYAQPDPSLPAGINDDVFNIGHYHSTYFTLAVCGGLLGLAAFVWLMIAVWRSLGNVVRASTQTMNLAFAARAAMLSFLFTGLFDWTFGDAEVVTMFWFVIGLGLGQADAISSSAHGVTSTSGKFNNAAIPPLRGVLLGILCSVRRMHSPQTSIALLTNLGYKFTPNDTPIIPLKGIGVKLRIFAQSKLIPPAPFSWEEKGENWFEVLKIAFSGRREFFQRWNRLFSPSLFKRRGRGMSSDCMEAPSLRRMLLKGGMLGKPGL